MEFQEKNVIRALNMRRFHILLFLLFIISIESSGDTNTSVSTSTKLPLSTISIRRDPQASKNISTNVSVPAIPTEGGIVSTKPITSTTHFSSSTSLTPLPKLNSFNFTSSLLLNASKATATTPAIDNRTLNSAHNSTLTAQIVGMEGGGSVELRKQTASSTSISPLSLDLPLKKGEGRGKITARKGVSLLDAFNASDDAPLVKRPSTTVKPVVVVKKKKPLITMVSGDSSSEESESFIESPTTGKDYVLPIVLFILAIPAFACLIKVIYKRGTEFTERQQYHRMYLIDGKKSSSFDDWKSCVSNAICRRGYQIIKLQNFGTLNVEDG